MSLTRRWRERPVDQEAHASRSSAARACAMRWAACAASSLQATCASISSRCVAAKSMAVLM
jgi:hypothetical protein